MKIPEKKLLDNFRKRKIAQREDAHLLQKLIENICPKCRKNKMLDKIILALSKKICYNIRKDDK